MKIGCRGVCLLLALALLFTGCSLDVDNLLQPPRMQGEQQAIQQALETYIRDSGGPKAGRYTLKYPFEGKFTAAFILCDGTGAPLTGKASDAQMAVAFYALATAPEVTHINLLHRSGGEWMSVGDQVGGGAAIRQVLFGDLDGDGMQELLTGWSTYNSKDHRLAVYSLTDGLTLLDDQGLYTDIFVGDLAGVGHDDVLLLHIGAGNAVSAAFNRLDNRGLQTLSTAAIDGYIQQFGQMTLCRLSDGTYGLFVDAQKSGDTTITELLYVEDNQLKAPFHDRAANVTTATGRASGLASRDINGDGVVEIPVSTPLPAAADHKEAVTGYLTVWMAYQKGTGKWAEALHSVVNPEDGYLVALPDGSWSHLDTAYSPESHTLELRSTVDNTVWLRIRKEGADTQAPSEGLSSLELKGTDGEASYTVQYHPAYVNSEWVYYMVMRLTGEEGSR